MKIKSQACSTGHDTGVLQTRPISKRRRLHVDWRGRGRSFRRALKAAVASRRRAA